MKKLIALLFATTISTQFFSQNGEENFKMTCASCHTIGKGLLVGPDLKGAHKKHKEKWLVKWIKSSQTMVNEGDKTAVELFNQYNQIPMPDNPQFSDADIKALIAYIKKQSGDEDETVAATNSQSKIADEKKLPEETQQNLVSEVPLKEESNKEQQSNATSEANTAVKAPIENSTLGKSGNTFLYMGYGIGILFFLTVLLMLARTVKILSNELKNKQ